MLMSFGLLFLLGVLQDTSGPAATLPAPTSLVASLRAHQDEIAAIRRHYTWNVKVTDDELDDKGNVRKSTSMTYEMVLVRGHRYRKLIARNGVPLTTEDAAKQD